ncbi:MAG: thermonuclease family protein, partial [Mesorhizobium sp.]
MSRSWPPRRRRPYVAPPRSLWRRLVDYGLAVVILGLLSLLAARLDRVETRKTQGTAIVNDGDSI